MRIDKIYVEVKDLVVTISANKENLFNILDKYVYNVTGSRDAKLMGTEYFKLAACYFNLELAELTNDNRLITIKLEATENCLSLMRAIDTYCIKSKPFRNIFTK